MSMLSCYGGTLEIEWSKEDNHVYMTGPAVTVFEGELEGKKIMETPRSGFYE